MTDEEKKLEEMFLKYEKRKQIKSEESKLLQSKAKALRDKTIECITKTIIPVMDKFVKEIVAKGHHVVITKNLEIGCPTVAFSLTLNDLLQFSEISFIHSDAGTIKIETKIGTERGTVRDTSPFQIAEKHEKVTEQWVETMLLSFIEDVLKAN